MKLSVVVPAHNEEENIGDAIVRIEEAIRGIPHEFIVVNDHSRDNTALRVSELTSKYPDLRLVENQRKGSFANALRTGFDNASGDCVVPVMADLCDDTATLRKMYEKMLEGYDIVCGARYIKGGARIGGPKVKAFFSRFVGVTMHYLVGIPTYDVPNAFKMYRKTVLNSVLFKARAFEISMEITLNAYFAGFRITEVPTVWKEREKGVSTFKTFQLTPMYLRVYLWAIGKRILSLCRRSP